MTPPQDGGTFQAMETDENRPPALPVYLITWTTPRQQRDSQKAAAAVGKGSLVQLVRNVLTELHTRLASTELGAATPLVMWVNGDALEEIPLQRTDTSWDRLNRVGSVNYSLDHITWPVAALLSAPVPFCPGCLGRGGAHAAGCWAGDKSALPRA